MLFNNLTFLVLFLPLVVVAYYLVPGRPFKNLVLIGASVVFYAAGGLKGVFVLGISILLNFLCGYAIDALRQRGRRATLALVAGVIGNVVLLGYFKYAGFLLGTANTLLDSAVKIPEVVMPIGVSFFTFQGLSYIIDVYRGRGPASKDPLDIVFYLGMFPVVTSGPIVRWETFHEQITNRSETLESVAQGAKRFVIGLAKKLIIAGPLGTLAAMTFDVAPTSLATAEAWVGALAFTLQIYFDFSGYSDMAVGLGMMFGLKIPENFNFPYISQSVSDFWRRWHMSLGRWFREYVYIPLGGNRVSTLANVRNILAVWALTGLWHGASWSFVAWGLYYGVLMLVEKFVIGERLERIPRVIRHAATMLAVIVGWVFFRSSTLPNGLDYLAVMSGLKGTGMATDQLLFMFNQYHWELFAGLAFSLPVFSVIVRARERWTLPGTEGVLGLLETAGYGVLLVVCLSYVVSGSFQPFLYAKF